MKYKLQLFLLILVIVSACDEAEDIVTPELEVENPVEEEVTVVDTVKPTITVTGFTDIIEKKTDISISIEDDSTVETKVLHEGEELIASSEKQFDLTVNPYPILVGTTDFTVVSEDAMGNETSETYTVEIKHLLIENYYLNHSSNVDVSYKNWIFFNSLKGKELAVFEPTSKNQKVYTDETVFEDYILFTSANHVIWPTHSGTGNETFIMRTYKIPVGEKRQDDVVNNHKELQNTVEVVLNGIPLVNSSPDFYAFGGSYNTIAHDGDEKQTKLTIKHDGEQPIYIRTNRWGGSTPRFDGKKENYRYAVLKPEIGNTILQIESNQLSAAENTLKLDIPEQDPGTLFFHRNAYESNENLDFSKSFSIYDKDSSAETIVVDYLDLPVFPNFKHYINDISYAKDGFYFNAHGSDADLDVNMPNWSATANITNDSIEVIAANTDVDYYTLALNKQTSENDKSLHMAWNFYVEGNSENDNKLPFLDLPNTIKETLNESYFQTTDEMDINFLSAADYKTMGSYNEIVNWIVFNNEDFKAYNYSHRSVGFPIPNSSGKSKAAKWQDNGNIFSHHVFDISGLRPEIY